MLQLKFLGGLDVFVNNQAVHFPTNKARALFAYLVLSEKHSHSRLSLATLLWPNLSEEKGLRNLRVTLYRLRQPLEEIHGGISEEILLATRYYIQYSHISTVQCDALQFQPQRQGVHP